MDKEQQISPAMIEKLISVTKIDAACEQIYTAMAARVWRIYGSDIPEVKRAAIQEKVRSKMDLHSEIRDVYKKYYSPDDILNLIQFYRTETGKKLLQNQAKLGGDLVDLMFSNSNKFAEELVNEIENHIDD